MARKNDVSIEATFERLEALIEKLEDEEVELVDALAAFEEGIKLTREAQKVLKKTEQKVQTLLEESGELRVESFQDEEPG